MMTDDELEAIRARAEEATPGPWIVMPELCGTDGQGVYHAESLGPICEVGDPYPRGDNRPQENMTFIAHAREDIPALLADRDELVAEVFRLRALVGDVLEKHRMHYVDPIYGVGPLVDGSRNLTGQEKFCCGKCRMPWPCDIQQALNPVHETGDDRG